MVLKNFGLTTEIKLNILMKILLNYFPLTMILCKTLKLFKSIKNFSVDNNIKLF